MATDPNGNAVGRRNAGATAQATDRPATLLAPGPSTAAQTPGSSPNRFQPLATSSGTGTQDTPTRGNVPPAVSTTLGDELGGPTRGGRGRQQNPDQPTIGHPEPPDTARQASAAVLAARQAAARQRVRGQAGSLLTARPPSGPVTPAVFTPRTLLGY